MRITHTTNFEKHILYVDLTSVRQTLSTACVIIVFES